MNILHQPGLRLALQTISSYAYHLNILHCDCGHMLTSWIYIHYPQPHAKITKVETFIFCFAKWFSHKNDAMAAGQPESRPFKNKVMSSAYSIWKPPSTDNLPPITYIILCNKLGFLCRILPWHGDSLLLYHILYTVLLSHDTDSVSMVYPLANLKPWERNNLLNLYSGKSVFFWRLPCYII